VGGIVGLDAALSEEERDEWSGLAHLLMRLADLHTWGAEGTRQQVTDALERLAGTMQENERRAGMASGSLLR
jgi:hypothetical protein